MSEEGNQQRILHVPRSIHPIHGIHDRIPNEDSEPPFFGYAPGETPVRIVNCPECNRQVSAAHLATHQQLHETVKQEPSRRDEHFHLQTQSRLIPQTPCPYAERQIYTFNILFDGNK